MPTGMDLKVERVRARATITDLALAMGISRQRVSQIEALAVVKPAHIERYRAALLQLAEKAENGQSAA